MIPTSVWLIWGGTALVSGLILGSFLFRARSQATGAKTWRSTCMWAILLVIGWFCLKPTSSSETPWLVLTQGTDFSVARRLMKELGKNVPVYALPAVAIPSDFPVSVTHVPDLAWLYRHWREGGQWHVLGWGFAPEMLAGFDTGHWNLHLSPTPIGFAHVAWPTALALGESLQVNALLGQPAKKGWKVQLLNPTGEATAARVLEEGETRVALATVPSAVGGLTFSLQIQDEAEQEVATELLPVFVNEPDKLEVWSILGAPRFEMKFLRNWLGEAGMPMALRTQLTESDWREEAVNLTPLAKDLARRDWSAPDVLLVDYLALHALSQKERNLLKTAVENGLGLLCLPEGLEDFQAEQSASEKDFFAPWQILWEDEGIEMLEAQLIWSGPVPVPAAKVPHLPGRLNLGTGQTPVVEDAFGVCLVAKISRGEGMVALSLVRDTHRLALMGNSPDFAGYWSHVLGELARPKTVLPEWHFQHPTRAGFPGEWQVLAPDSTANTSTGKFQENQAFWQSDSLKLGMHSGRMWPDQSGWHVPVWMGQALRPTFVYPSQSWLFEIAETRLQAMSHLGQQSQGTTHRNVNESWKWLWILVPGFMVFGGWAWIREKLGHG